MLPHRLPRTSNATTTARVLDPTQYYITCRAWTAPLLFCRWFVTFLRTATAGSARRHHVTCRAAHFCRSCYIPLHYCHACRTCTFYGFCTLPYACRGTPPLLLLRYTVLLLCRFFGSARYLHACLFCAFYLPFSACYSCISQSTFWLNKFTVDIYLVSFRSFQTGYYTVHYRFVIRRLDTFTVLRCCVSLHTAAWFCGSCWLPPLFFMRLPFWNILYATISGHHLPQEDSFCRYTACARVPVRFACSSSFSAAFCVLRATYVPPPVLFFTRLTAFCFDTTLHVALRAFETYYRLPRLSYRLPVPACTVLPRYRRNAHAPHTYAHTLRRAWFNVRFVICAHF